jgi:hypothetical protein
VEKPELRQGAAVNNQIIVHAFANVKEHSRI